jgi:hypothetical protein
MNNKFIAIALGSVAALFALSLVVRFVLLSEYGLSGGWMFVGLPFGGIGIAVLLLRLGVFNSGQRSGSTMVPWQHHIGMQAPPFAPPAPAAAAAGTRVPADQRRHLSRGVHRKASTDHVGNVSGTGSPERHICHCAQSATAAMPGA